MPGYACKIAQPYGKILLSSWPVLLKRYISQFGISLLITVVDNSKTPMQFKIFWIWIIWSDSFPSRDTDPYKITGFFCLNDIRQRRHHAIIRFSLVLYFQSQSTIIYDSFELSILFHYRIQLSVDTIDPRCHNLLPSYSSNKCSARGGMSESEHSD